MDLGNLFPALEELYRTASRATRVGLMILLSLICVALGSLLWVMQRGAIYDTPLRYPQAEFDLSECGQGVVGTVEHLQQHRLLVSTPSTENLIKELCK